MYATYFLLSYLELCHSLISSICLVVILNKHSTYIDGTFLNISMNSSVNHTKNFLII